MGAALKQCGGQFWRQTTEWAAGQSCKYCSRRRARTRLLTMNELPALAPGQPPADRGLGALLWSGALGPLPAVYSRRATPGQEAPGSRAPPQATPGNVPHLTRCHPALGHRGQRAMSSTVTLPLCLCSTSTGTLEHCTAACLVSVTRVPWPRSRNLPSMFDMEATYSGSRENNLGYSGSEASPSSVL